MPKIPVLHPDGQIHQIEVDEKTHPADLHDLLQDYHFTGNLSLAMTTPTWERQLEHSADFKDKAKEVIQSAGTGPNSEGLMTVDQAGKSHLEKPSTEIRQRSDVPVSDEITAYLHTHPSAKTGASQTPSKMDVKTAKSLGKPLYLASEDGLYLVRPEDGSVVRIFSKKDWYEIVQPKPGTGVDPRSFSIEILLKNGRKVYVDGGKNYPLEQMGLIRKNGSGDISPKDIKRVIAFSPVKND